MEQQLAKFKDFSQTLQNKNIINKKSFYYKLFDYYNFFNTELVENPLEPPFNNNVEYLKGYCSTVLTSLKRAYLKEHVNSDNMKFLRHIDSMRHNLRMTKFICTDSVCRHMLDYLNFLWRHYV